MRRGAVNRYFSKASISKLEPMIHELAQQLCDRLLACGSDGKPFEVTMAYSCYTTDVITSYCFGQSLGFLQRTDFEPNLRNAIHSGCKPLPVMRQWPFLFHIVNSMPEYAILEKADLLCTDRIQCPG
jgi:cytochrome P450